LRKLALSATLLAMALVVAAPAMAQSVSQVVQSTGGNVSCSVSTQNGQTIVQVSGVVNGVQVSDTFSIAGPQVSVDCQQLLQQAAAKQATTAKASNAEATAAPAPATKAQIKQAGTAKANKVEATAAPAPATKAQIQELPKTGGGAILLWGLGASILLVASGLLSRRIIR
jgi:hypothetical protein